jgi:DNA repair photolyase
VQPANRYDRFRRVRAHEEGLDLPPEPPGRTVFHEDRARTVVNAVPSPDVGMDWSLNPYQGCEHGCAYCYARPTHAYWGYSPGLDFERHVVVKTNAVERLEAWFRRPGWEAAPIALSGNTDPYQPAERRYRLTRSLLETFLAYRHPVSLITKNRLILRDLDLLAELAALDLVHVHVSLTTLDERLRRRMEPRTATGRGRLEVVRALRGAGVPVRVLLAPIIPGLNDIEVPDLMAAAAEAGALDAGMLVVRLNGEVADVFREWLETHYPDRADTVWNGIAALHGGRVDDHRFGRRMRGEGARAEALRQLGRVLRRRHFGTPDPWVPATHRFRRPGGTQLGLFGPA